MDLSKPRSHSDLILYIWKIIDLPKILKNELAFHISFVLYLMNYDKAIKLIKSSLEKNLLFEHKGYLVLSSELEKKLEAWQKNRKTEISSRLEKENRLDKKREQGRPSKTKFSALLKAFLDKGTLNRAAALSEAAFEIFKFDFDDQEIKARVHGSKDEPYIIEINLKEKKVEHDCHDFQTRRAKNKKFCKHLIKLFIILREKNEEKTIKFLKELSQSINEFNFTS